VIAETGTALRGAWDDACASWSSQAWLAAGLLAAAALVPLLLPGSVRLEGLAETVYLAAAAVGLGFAIGIGGMPSVAQGAFVGLGAIVAAHLAPGWPPLAAAALGGAAAAGAGLAVGAAVVRFRPVYVAAATWIVTWLFALALDAFPGISGGSGGLVVTPVWTPTIHYEVALALVALSLLGHWTLARSSFGLSLRAAAARPAAAAALGVQAPRLRLRAFAGAAALAGLAGGFAVQLVGVADPAAYGPLLSFKLLVAVLVGGAVSSLGPAVGMLVVASLTPIADLLGRLTGAETARFGPMLAALLLLAFLTAGGEGLVPLATRRLRRRGAPPEPASPAAAQGAELEVRDLTKRFDGLVALDGLGLRLDPGRTVALIGPNGSGKTTALRLLAGTLEPDAGRIVIGGDDVTGEPPGARVRRGLVRTLQANAVFPELTALENAVVGASVRRRYGGAFRTLVATPKARSEDRETRAAALAALRAVGLEHLADARAETLSTAEQRLLMLASALATSPRVLLVDEPSAAAGASELERLTRVLGELGAQGLALLIVEHNLRLVRSLADEVVVLDAGKKLAAGTPDEIARHPAVRAAYLGRQPF
jgi:ABC-type branched-subunit amino acid transport system ATPase component/ABC-type branched-subunit amino acid transport system permease subunit